MKLFSLLLSSLFCSTLLVRPNLSPNTKEDFTADLILDSICNSVVITPGNNSITISGVNNAPIVAVQVFDNNWVSVFNQAFTGPQETIVVPSLPAGQYVVNTKFYTTGWAIICEKAVNITVGSNPPPPPADSCSTTFQKTYGNTTGDEMIIDITKAKDGGYVGAGQTSASGNTNHDALLAKFDSKGILSWTKTFGAAQEDFFTDIITTSDGGYLVAGSINSNGYLTGTGDAWLIKTDDNGNIQWQMKYSGSSGQSAIGGILETSDGGFAYVGQSPSSAGAADVMVVKTDASGNIVWQKKVGSSSTDDGVGIIEDNHGSAGIIITGYSYSSTWYDADVAKFDLNTGALLWNKTYDFDNRANRLGKIWKVADGFLIRAANHDGYNADNAIAAIVKIDFNGNLISVKEFKAPGCIDGHAALLADGGFLIANGEGFTDPNSDLHLIRTDATGNILWTERFPRADVQWINSMITDGNFVVAGGFSKSGSYNDGMLLKVDLSGKMGSCTPIQETGVSRVPKATTLSSEWSSYANLGLTSSVTSFTPAQANLTTTILCIDSCIVRPTVSTSNVTVNESAGNATLQICLSAASTEQITVQYGTSNGTAIAGSDYTASNGTATIAAGQTCTTINIPILNDAVQESTENFTVTLSSPVNATIGTSTGTVTINDDDQAQYDCNSVTFNAGNQSIAMNGLTAPIVAIQIFNSSWATVFNQAYTNSPGTVNVSLAPGTYLAKVTFYTNGWVYICDKSQNVTIVNQCPAGTICAFNTCPSQTVNLNNFYSIPNLPAGTAVSWHTATPATDANKMTDAQAHSVSTAGTYYAAINISGANCYSQAIPVNVTITPCNSAGNMADLQAKTAIEMPSERIMVYPNPFTHSVRVTIQSEMNERAVLVLTDLMGQQLRTKPVQLARGSNQFSLEGLDHFPSGSYLLKVTSSSGTQTFKLLRQQ